MCFSYEVNVIWFVPAEVDLIWLETIKKIPVLFP